MNENINTIKDPTLHIKPGEKLIKFLQDNSESRIGIVPENVKCLIENREALLKGSDIEWLNAFLNFQRKMDKNGLLTGKELYDEVDKLLVNKFLNFDFQDLLKEKNKKEIYLHELLEGSELVLPKNERIRRNPILAERIDRLKKEQEKREYEEMTKNVDLNKKYLVEDTVGYQMNMMNRHLIAVAQFLVSVGAGFAFGFLGFELIVGHLTFGFRLLLGIACALIIAIAEFYFLAKQLNEEEKQEMRNFEQPATVRVKPKGKLHKD